MAHSTTEMHNILAKGQFKSGINPLAVLDGLLEGNIAGAVIGGTEYGATSSLHAKCGTLHEKVKIIPMDYSLKNCTFIIKCHAEALKKQLLVLNETPTNNPYIAYYSKGALFSNPTVVVVEIEKVQDCCELIITAFTTKVGFVRNHSCKVAMKKFIEQL